MWWNWNTQVVTKLKNSNSDKTQELKMWRTQIVTKLKNSKCDKTQKFKLHRKKLNNSNCDKTATIRNLNICGGKKPKKGPLVRTFWHLANQWYVLWAAFCDCRNVFVLGAWRSVKFWGNLHGLATFLEVFSLFPVSGGNF